MENGRLEPLRALEAPGPLRPLKALEAPVWRPLEA